MKSVVLLLILALVVAVLLIAFSTMSKPEVEVERIAIRNLEISHMDAEIAIVIHNHYPFGATVEKIVFDAYYVSDGKDRHLGSGEKDSFRVDSGATTVAIPMRVSNLGLLSALVEAATKGSVTVKVNGTATVAFPFISYDIPFEDLREIPIY